MKKSVEETEASHVQDWLRVVQEKVSGLSYGEVHITIHDGQVTQVQQTEKFRFQVGKKNHQKNKP